MIYSKHYLATFKKFQDVTDVECVITLEKLPSQTENPIFVVKGIPRRKVFTDNTMESNISSIMFLRQTLEEAVSINGGIKFPLNDINNRIAKIRFNNYTYTLDTKEYNTFNDIIRFNVSSRI